MACLEHCGGTFVVPETVSFPNNRGLCVPRNAPGVQENLMPAIGLGTWKSPHDQIVSAVVAAIKAGYRHIDCALVYGNEAAVGEGIRASGIPREQLFVTSKIWNSHHAAEHVRAGLQESLKRLGLDYLDLCLIHWPVGFLYTDFDNFFPKNEDGTMNYSDVHYLETWKALEALQKEGLCKSIGLSNFNLEQINHILANCTVRPAALQVECHPYLPQTELLAKCRAEGITVTAYCPLGSADRPWASGSSDPILLEDPVVNSIAAAHDVTPGTLTHTAAQVLIAWNVRRGLSVIPKSVTPERIEQNIAVLDGLVNKLSAQDMAALAELDRQGGVRYCLPVISAPDGRQIVRDLAHPHFPWKEECTRRGFVPPS